MAAEFRKDNEAATELVRRMMFCLKGERLQIPESMGRQRVSTLWDLQSWYVSEISCKWAE